MNSPISVSTLNLQIKSLLETTFIQVYVEGEISNLTYHNSGHIYFSIKDENSTLSCVMFKGNTKYLKFQLENGLKIVITGSLTVYAPRGNYQLLCNKIEPSGIGSLSLAFEQLKTKLEAKGYFERSRKKTLPRYPKKIAIVTSPTGAAIEDMKKVATHRWSLVEFILIPTLVQGEGASLDIANSIKYADKLNCDIMIVGRGGGSIEDLWAFNEEIVANAIYEAKTPIISAVGHEVDYLISDFVADIRAATPSNAIEIALPDINEHRIYLDSLENEITNRFKNILFNKEQELKNMKKLFEQNSIETKFNFIQTQINFIKSSLKINLNQKFLGYQNQIDLLKSNYLSNHPDKKEKNGFVQISKSNKVINLADLKIGDEIELQTPKYIASCTLNKLVKQ
ncbi:exodeoxyribonuclease VII large subunit [Aliarcobacter butzleri]|uniref:Exodeoxyribonuclease 7 large subunit n=2 Tax=Aliarcobacter butzleri TaxID=28197 RepID=A0AAW7PNK4_9BACT|nr:exodeoxyribonuclease VII large subunit [Aliarcobacter butzleri]KLE08632.1 exodeoxyribonuclease VII large subunit [Aliarcobacter butzleri L355]MCG3678067.1 exodeoxyribonuclease VII large subunit [Aliarcobacter butzleri]MCG3696098.1 exodeoxyribonuclease VII large subunit [Aliarcobacter butzleri]MCG3698216.1 exodeoxyribonuclease VII large subunit [Aliarcobacter butzleri]MCT7562782.1 exodeoxyribonuclease VII large subunit [Aliarcobacter butzleri]